MAEKKIIGKPHDGEPASEAEHFIKCPVCGGLIDCRDLEEVFFHETPGHEVRNKNP